MNFFRKKHSVCAECGVHFEPVTGYEARWGQFCATHRKEPRERDEKKDAVLAWAAKNWERLYGQMADEYQPERENLSDVQATTYEQQQAMVQAMKNAQQNTAYGYNMLRGVI